MKTTILSVALATIMLGTLPATANEFGAGSHVAGFELGLDSAPRADVFERRGRGHGGDDDRSGDDHRSGGSGGGHSSDDSSSHDRNDDHGGGRSSDDRSYDDHRANDGRHGGRPRVPGGSGCDDFEDLFEHPACRI